MVVKSPGFFVNYVRFIICIRHTNNENTSFWCHCEHIPSKLDRFTSKNQLEIDRSMSLGWVISSVAGVFEGCLGVWECQKLGNFKAGFRVCFHMLVVLVSISRCENEDR